MEQQEPMVDVELVCDRASKDDCRAGTATVWNGKGDVQPYPKRLWPKLAPHPDVWRLVNNDQPRIDLPELDAREIAAGTNTDLVIIDRVNTTAEVLEQMTDEDVRAEGDRRGYVLNPRLNSTNLRLRFLDAQDAVAMLSGGESTEA
jgi:hypothetical protein